MATVRLYLDRRAVGDGAPAPLKLALTQGGSTAYIGLDVKVMPWQWDPKTEKVTARADKAGINTYLLAMKARAMGLLSRIDVTGMTTTQVKDRVKRGLQL